MGLVFVGKDGAAAMAPLSVQRFLAALDARLAGLDADGLRAGLGRYGTGLPAEEREAFLAGLAAALPGSAAPGTKAGANVAQDPELLGDIDAFIEALEAGEYVVEDDYDYRYDECEPENSEAVGEVEGLLAATDRVFLAGDLALAREAYGRLFRALRENEGSGLSGVALGESAERYLRAVYEGVADPVERAGELSEAWLSDIPGHRPPTSLAAVREALPVDLRGLDEFAAHWTAELTARSLEGHESTGVGVLRGLLTEAALASAGTDGLGRVARAGGPGQADAYRAWIDVLRSAGRFVEAEQACREALDAAPTRKGPDTRDGYASGAQMIGWHRWAAIADRAAALAQHRGDTSACLGFGRRAWDLDPTTRRLCALFVAAEQARQGGGPHAIDQLVAAMSAERSRDHGFGTADAGGLPAQAVLLAGRLDVAVQMLSARNEGYADPSATLLPYLLAAGAGRALAASAQFSSTVLFALVSDIGRDRYADLNVFDDPEDEAGRGGGADTVGTEPRHAELGAVLVDLLAVRAAQPSRGETEKAWLAGARAGVDSYLERIVGGQHRRSYPAAARMAVACAEALIMAGETTSYLVAARSAYPRHSSFHRELDKARSDSPLLRGRPGGSA